MKIKIIFNSSYPLGKVSTNRTHQIALGLIKAGASVEIIITQPTEKFNEAKNFFTSGEFENVKYKYISKRTLRYKNRMLNWIFDYYSHLLLIFKLLFTKEKFEYIIVIGPSVDFRVFLPLVAKLRNIKILLEINEFPFVGKRQSISTKLKTSFFLKFIIPQFNGFLVISENLKKLILSYKSNKSEVLKVPILALPVNKISTKISRPIEDNYMFHAGSLFESKDGIIDVFEAYAKSISSLNLPLKFILTGSLTSSPHHIEIQNIIDKYKLNDNVLFTGFLSEKELENYLKFASVAIINKKQTKQNIFCFATKITDYIKFNVPIITTNIGEVIYFFKDNKNAFIAEVDSVKSLAEKLIQVVNNQKKSTDVALAAKKLIHSDFNTIIQGRNIYDFLKKF